MKTTALIAVAGLAAAATAQTITLSLVPSSTSVAFGETFTIAVNASFSGGTAVAFGLANLRISVDPASGFTASNLVASPNFFQQAGAILTANTPVGGATAQGGNLPPSFIPGDNDLFTGGTLFSFDVTAGDVAGDFSYSVGRNNAAQTLFRLFSSLTSTSGGPLTIQDSAVTINTATITVTPTPGAAGVLALGGLVAARRRRA